MLALPAAAQSTSRTAAEPTAEPASSWGLGIAASSARLPYKGYDSKNSALPLLFYENSWVRFNGASADFKVWRRDFGAGNSVELAARLKYDLHGYESGDSPFLVGMDERKGGFWGGGAVTWNNNLARVSGEWLADVSRSSKGQMLQLKVDRRFGVGNMALTPRIQAQWLDAHYVDYYYGVRAGEARPARARYTGQAAVTLEAGVRLDYQLLPRQTVFLDLSATSLPKEIKNSPIVDRSSTSRMTIGYLYRF